MSALNQITIIGNLGRDPEVRRTNAGDPVCNFSVAVTEKWKDKATGERKEATEWFDIVIWNANIVEIAERYLKKGSKVYLSGKMKSRKYTDRENVERKVWELVIDRFGGQLLLLGDPAGRDNQSDDGGRQRDDGAAQRQTPQGGGRPPIDDDIPFGHETR